MKKLVFGNIDYKKHMTNEGDQLQEGLVAAGWDIVGFGYPNNMTDTIQIINTLKPDIVFVQDKRDWFINSGGCYDKRVNFTNISYISSQNNIFKVTVLKDAASALEFQKNFVCGEVKADAILTYYHEESINRHNYWMRGLEHKAIRTYHSIDKDVIKNIPINKTNNVLVSGALGDIYPVRQMVFNNNTILGVDIKMHPGYNNHGTDVNNYLKLISSYKVHIATASKYGFALRKIMESVACQCVCITTLPQYDVLPEIDDCLIRITNDIPLADLGIIIENAVRTYNPEKAKYYADKCLEYYDYRNLTKLIDKEITRKIS